MNIRSSAVQHVIEESVLRAAETVEQQLDAQLYKLDNLDEDDLDRIRQKRLDDLKKLQAKKQQWLANGHGELRHIEEKDFFNEMKGVERMICLFYRESQPGDIMHKHLSALAASHIETKFVKIHAEKSPFLTERLRIWMLPTIAIIKNEKTTDYIVGLDELGGADFPLDVLEARLVNAGVLFEDTVKKPAGGTDERRAMRKGGSSTMTRTESDEDSDFE